MKFCSVCDMYYYISIDENDDNKIVYYETAGIRKSPV
jgi:hypothetical protein